MKKKILIVPPPQIGGGPSNAVLRCIAAMKQYDVEFTANMFSTWQSILVNVGLGFRNDVLRLIKFGRRVVYRIDGCYVKEIFEKEGNPWMPEYEKINIRIRQALRSSDHVIYQSKFAKQNLDKLFTRPEGSYSLVYNGVNLDTFSPSDRKKNVLPTIGCIGTFRKNRVSTITDISKHIPFQHCLLLVGRMDEQCCKDLESFKQNSQKCKLEYVPYITGDTNLAEYHRKIDCFIHPILGDTCPNSVVEALACGTPVVVPQFAGGGELVKDGGIVFYTSPDADYQVFIEECAKSVVKVFENWSEYSAKARQRAVDVLDVNVMARQYLKALFPPIELIRKLEV